MSADQKTAIQNSLFKSYYNMLGFTPEWIEEVVKEDPSVTNYWDAIVKIADNSSTIGDLTELTTPDKNNVVEAINYLNSKVG